VTTADQLRAAAQYIREHGLLAGSAGFDGGPRCMIGALYSVSLSTPRILHRVCGPSIADFSDACAKVGADDDAIAALEIAADLAS
jgi:hypothetical protein